MDLGGWRWLVAALVALMQLGGAYVSSRNVVLNVKHRFAGTEKQLATLNAHDARRRARILSSIDLPLGGDGLVDSTALYFTKIGLGTPSKDYYVQVDTGSDVLWVNCVGCTNCPDKTDLKHVELKLYDERQSSTSKVVSCDEDFCTLLGSQKSDCSSGSSCDFNIVYGDGSTIKGHLVRDTIQLDQVTGNHQTGFMNGVATFGCATEQTGQLGGSIVVGGILGFGQSNSSLISQLAAAGKVKKTFAHCLDPVNGGGIFAIGSVVSPKVKTTPLVPNQAHYNVVLKEVEVGGSVLDLPTDVFDAGVNRGAIIDSGTTLVYLPSIVFKSLMDEILVRQPGLELHTLETYYCFQSDRNINDGFPRVIFHFEGSVSLTVYPQDYIFQIREDVWCFGWQNGGSQTKDGSELTILGDMALSNKLVVYDVEKQVLGWTDYNCSSSIQMKDEASGAVYTVNAHNLSSTPSLKIGKFVNLFWILVASGLMLV